MTKLFEAAAIIDPAATKRSVIGTTLQHPSVRPWDRSVVWAIVSAIRPVWSGKWDDNATAVLQRYEAFIQRVHELNLPADIDRAPILDVSLPWIQLLYGLTTGQRDQNCPADQAVANPHVHTQRSQRVAAG